MRWLYIDPTQRTEVEYRARVLKSIDAWWRAFVEQAPRIDDVFSRRDHFDLPDWMHAHLHPIDARLMWEFGPGVAGGKHRLVITPEAHQWLRPIVATLLDRAPKIPGWEFYAYRLASSSDRLPAIIEARTGASLDGVLAAAKIGAQGKVDLTFTGPDCRRESDAKFLQTAFVTAESLLGEELLEKWIGRIEVEPLPKRSLIARLSGKSPGGKNFLPLDRFAPIVQALVDSLKDQLPRQPFFEVIESCDWSVVEISAEPAGKDPAARSDLTLATTAHLHLLQAWHTGRFVDSACYSRVGETFCYLKLDAQHDPPELRIEGRTKFEDALNAALISAKLGCVIGAGTGQRYSYLDLALTNLPAAIETVRDVLRQQRAPRRSWLMFFDTTLAQEWLGIWDDTPSPPAVEIDE